MYARFRRVRGLGYMTDSEMLQTMHENDLFDMLHEFPNVVLSLQCYLIHRSSSALRLRSTMGKKVSIHRTYEVSLSEPAHRLTLSVVTNDMDRIIDILGRRRDNYFFV